ncbi:aldehyde dehydrogenase 22A1 [Lactuca sativa]|uniref:aldehyde dehydrogenase 22A1 n=1 Tax=Lactuca sativa TaxID=4236 RepID=UPI000CD97E0B|nr:aldehyde dehydrogenase 22A1 [Lactuca sativa]
MFAETGEALVSSVDKIVIVNSPGVGRMIMRKAADTLILVILVLGGKDLFIVYEAVDVAHQISGAALQSSVQNCAGAKRFYSHKDIYASFVVAVFKIVKSVSAGPPQLGKYDMGVICMQDHSERFQSLINDALDKGAEIVGGGNVRDISEGAVDQYFPPTVIVNVNHQMKLMQEELPCKNCDKYGCITSAETVMLEKKSVDEFLSNINNGRNVIISLSL